VSKNSDPNPEYAEEFNTKEGDTLITKVKDNLEINNTILLRSEKI
jgi:hypothetical protein